MQEFWYCSDHRVKLEQYVNRYSSNPYFNISKKNIEGSLNNAIAVKKITTSSIARGVTLANKFFTAFPENDELECVGTMCPKCKKIYCSPRYVTAGAGDLDIDFYNYFWIFRTPVTEKPLSNRSSYLLFYFRYLLFAYILNYTILLEMRVGKRYIKFGMFVFFPILFVIILYAYINGYV